MLFWFLVSVRTSRLNPYFAIAALPGLYGGLSSIFETVRLSPQWRPVAKGFFLLFFVTIAILVIRDVRYRNDYLRFGLGVNERTLPAGAADFIEKEGLPGLRYNDFGDGGYFIWRFYPERKVFQDGRTQAYPDDFLRVFNSRVPY